MQDQQPAAETPRPPAPSAQITRGKVIAILAADRNGAIGKGGSIPWHYPSDMRHFRNQTAGRAVVMGHKTWLSLGEKPLKNRLNVVLTRESAVAPQPGVVVLRDVQSALSLKDYLCCDLVVIGGEQIYREFAPHVDRWVVTEIPLEVEGADTHAPAGYLDGFAPVDRIELEEGLAAVVYERPPREA